jgi:integrase
LAWIQRLERKRGTVSYKVYWRDLGKRIRTRTFQKSKDAHRFLREIEHQKDTGSYIDPALGRITMATFWDHFIRTAGPASLSTQALYELQARKYILPRLGHVPLNVITKPLVREFLADLRDEGLGVPSVNSVYRLLRRILSVAGEEDRIRKNPASGIDLAKAPSREMNFLQPAEVERLAQEVPKRYKALIYFLAYTGTRIGEAAALRIRNVDLLKRQVRIVEASKEVGGRLFIGPTKNKLNRGITLPSFLADMLGEHIGAFSDGSNPDALVFQGAGSGFIRQANFRNRVFRPAAVRAGLPAGVRPHDLRHTACAFAIKAGWHPRKIQEMLGHASIEVTMGTYGHLFDSLHGDSADKLDAIYRATQEAQEVSAVVEMPKTVASRTG